MISPPLNHTGPFRCSTPTARLPALLPLASQPRPIVLDSNLRTPPASKLLENHRSNIGHQPTIICAKTPTDSTLCARRAALEHHGAKVVESPTDSSSPPLRGPSPSPFGLVSDPTPPFHFLTRPWKGRPVTHPRECDPRRFVDGRGRRVRHFGLPGVGTGRPRHHHHRTHHGRRRSQHAAGTCERLTLSFSFA